MKAVPVQGWLQFTADDCAQVFVNGHNCGFANDWRTTTTAEVTKYLKAGSNLLAFQYINEHSYGGVIAELYVQYADGSCERINSDGSFRCAVAAADSWNTPAFDDSAWKNAVEQAAPPAYPWQVTLPYRHYRNMQRVTGGSIAPASVRAGDTVTITLTGKGKIPDAAFNAALVLKSGSRVVWQEEITLKPEHFKATAEGTWELKYPYVTPRYLNTHKLQLSFESDLLAAQSAALAGLTLEIRRLAVDPDYPVKKPFRVVNRNGRPRFELDGKPFFAAWIWGGKQQQLTTPFNLITVTPKRVQLWPSVNVLNFDVLDQTAETIRRRFPNAYFIWDIDCYVPYDWPKLYPDEMCKDENGRVNNDGELNYSFSSPRLRKDLAVYIEKVVRYLENSPYANRIVGYRLSGGHTVEWLGWDPRGKGALDFSPCARQDFARFLERHYPDVTDRSVPKKAERLKRDGTSLLWDQQKHRRAIAYNDFTSQVIVSLIADLGAKLRTFVGPDKVIGTYYGYVSTLNYPGCDQHRAHFALKPLLDAKVFDFLLSPNSYALRALGETCGDMKPFASMQFHNIVPACEDDTRTHNGYDVMTGGGSRDQTVTEAQSLGIERRNMGIYICRDMPDYYLPHGGETPRGLDFPAMVRDIEIMRRVGQHCWDAGARRNAEVALVVSEESIKAMPLLHTAPVASGIIDQHYKGDGTVEQEERMKRMWSYETFIGAPERMARSGAPFDQLLAEDLADHPGEYKLYIFLNCFKIDAAFRKAVAKLRERKCVLLWLYAPGYINGAASALANMKDVTGLDFEKIDTPLVPVVRMADKREMGTPGGQVTPLFAVTTKNAEVLGHYRNGKVGAAALPTGKALTVFSGAWQLDIPFITGMLKRAGVRRYLETSDPVEANDSLVVVHARFPGKKRITFPKKTMVLDVFNKKIIARDADAVECDFALHETRFFYYGNDAETLLKKLQ